MAARTVNDYLDLLTHAVGDLDARNPAIDIFNDAARSLMHASAWPWRKSPVTLVRPHAPITITGATYAGSTLTSAGAFTNYTFYPGDLLVVTGGTGATTGTYRIAGKTSNDAITLTDTLGSPTTVDATISFPYLTPPSDFGQLLKAGIDNTGSFSANISRVVMCTPESIVELQEMGVITPNGCLYLAAQPTFKPSNTAQAVPKWPCYPTPTSATEFTVQIVYMRRWVDMTASASDVPPFPEDFEHALVLACRAFAVHIENQTEAMEDAALQRELARLRMEQGGVQTDFGPIRGGAMSPRAGPSYVTLGEVSF